MQAKYISRLFTAILVGLFLSGCRKSGTSWDTDITTPVFKTSFGIDHLLPDSILQKNTDSSMLLVYSKILSNYSLDSLVHIPDTAIKSFYSLPAGQIVFQTGDPITPPAPNNTTTTVYPLHGVGLKTAVLRSGIMHVSVRNRVRKKIQLNYQIPSASFNLNPFAATVIVPAAIPGKGPGLLSTDYDLSGYTVDMSGPNHNTINTVLTIINAFIDPAGIPHDTVLVTSNDSLVITTSFRKLVPEFAKGYFGQTTQKIGPATIPFSVFSKISSGSLLLQSVKLNFYVVNSVGLDARLNILDLYSTNSQTNTTVHLTGPIMQGPININRAVETHSFPPVSPSYYSQLMDNSNSNIKALIENLPDKLGYNLTLATDPLGNVSGFDDFIYYGYGLKAGFDLQIPLSLVANNLTLSDTLAVNFDPQNSNLSKLHSSMLRLEAGNGFPLDASVQLFTLDARNQTTDSLITGANKIASASVDLNFKATGETESLIQIPLSGNRISNLLHAKKIRLIVRFNTIGKPNYIKIYNSYLMNFRLSGDFNYTIKLH
jgi:hypothetical protein